MSAPLARGSDTGGSVRFRQGGSAATTARWFARLGGGAIFIGAVGRDAWGRRLVASLKAAEVTVRVARVTAPTARIVALVEPGGERSFVTERGAADLLTAEAVRPAWLRRVAGLHLPAYSLLHQPLTNAALRAVALARADGAAISLDLASRQPLLALGRDGAWSRLAAVAPDLLLANADEAAWLASGPVEQLLGLAPLVVVKEGASGCRILLRARPGENALQLAVATRALRPLDTTGAGDAFDAGFLLTWLAAPHDRRGEAALLRRAALAGHRAAARLLTEPRPELAL